MDALLSSPWFQTYGVFVASLLWALAIGWSCWQILSIVTHPRVQLRETHPFEFQRREELRAGNTFYRWFEPLVDEVGANRSKRSSCTWPPAVRNCRGGRKSFWPQNGLKRCCRAA
jgi:hypothetical protein